jgi:hypothetical protein
MGCLAMLSNRRWRLRCLFWGGGFTLYPVAMAGL